MIAPQMPPAHTKREAARALAKRGFRVLRVRPGTKFARDENWPEAATADPLAVYDLWTGDDGASTSDNVAVACRGLLVLDVDADKRGFESLETLPPLPETFTVLSPRGGKHFYFAAGDRKYANSVELLAPGLDTRGDGGYVLGPGSTFQGKSYTIAVDAPIAPVPEWLTERLQAPRPKSDIAGQAVCDLDTPAAVAEAVTYLAREAPEGQEGSRNDTAFKVACRLYDFGLSEPMTLQLMQSHWQCSPPLEELPATVANALKSRGNAVGHTHPTAGFSAVESSPAPAALTSGVRWYDETDETAAAIPERQWIVPGLLLRGDITLLVAPGATGKSTFTHQIQLALASALPGIIPYDVREPCKVLVINGEDKDDEMRRRTEAARIRFGVPREALKDRIATFSSRGGKFIVSKLTGREQLVPGPVVGELIALVKSAGIGVVVVDPFVSTHEGNENDNRQMNAVVDVYRRIADETGAAVMLVHHTSKPPQSSSDSFAGNANAGRGATAIVNSARIAVTMYGMSDKDAEKFNVPREHKHRYVRLDDAKANLTLASPHARWLTKETVQLVSGDGVGVLVPAKLSAIDDNKKLARALLPMLSQGPLSVSQAAAALSESLDYEGRSKSSLVELLCKTLREQPLEIGAGRVILLRPHGERGGMIEVQ